MDKGSKCKCQKCGHKWTTRVANPKSCPKCKQYTWREKGK